jgi:4'-phosphopantetheinyl transferase
MPMLVALLDSEERHRLSSYRRSSDAERFLVGVGVTRLVASKYLGSPAEELTIVRTCRECGQPHGKPSLVDQIGSDRLEFSVSHAGDVVGVAFTRGLPVGLDIAELRSSIDVEELAPIVLSDRESLSGETTEAQRVSFLIHWTRKEAAVKAVGIGLQLPFSAITVSRSEDEARLLEWHLEPSAGNVRVHDVASPEPHYVAALAVIGGDNAIRTFDATRELRHWRPSAGMSQGR